MENPMTIWWGRLTAVQQQLVKFLVMLPLSTAGEIAALQALSRRLVDDRLHELEDLGIAESVVLGCWTTKVRRWSLTLSAQESMGIARASWHQPGCLARLLERITTVEHVYTLASQFTELGRFREWMWFDDVSIDAACRYEQGWVAFLWVGPLRLEVRLTELFEQLGCDLEPIALGHPSPRPSLICCLAWDRWQADMTLKVAKRIGIERQVRVWCVADETWHGAGQYQPSQGWIRQPAYKRVMTYEKWMDRVEGSLWSAEGTNDPMKLLKRVKPVLTAAPHGTEADRRVRAEMRKLERNAGPKEKAGAIRNVAETIANEEEGAEAAAMLRRLALFLGPRDFSRNLAPTLFLVAKMPACTVATIQAVLGAKSDRSRAQNATAHLRDFGSMNGWADGRKHRYKITESAMKVLAPLDGTRPGKIWRRIEMKRWDNMDGFEQHEYGVADLVGQFLAAGCPWAAGWQIWESYGIEGAIRPDAAVYLSNSPFGPGWHYIEYERSARTPRRIRRKLSAYASLRREDNFPVLVVCATDLAERHFQEAGTAMDIGLVTTTIARLEKHGGVNNTACWRLGSQPVLLG